MPDRFALLAFALLFVALAWPVSDASASEVAPPDTLTEAHGWLTELGITFNLAQAAYHEWQEGGLSSLTVASNVNGRFARVTGDFRQRHDTRLAFGLTRQDTLPMRKSMDVIRYSTELQYTGLGAWLPTLASELRTQFAPGFDFGPTVERYPELAFLIRPGERLKVSDFFSPATWTQSIGLAYEPEGWFRFRAGLGLQESIVMIERLRPVYGNRPDQAVRLQAGLDALIEARGEPFENVRLQSRLTLFQAFTQIAESAPDVVWENLVQLRVNRWLSVNGEIVALYDRDVLDRVQLKQTAAIGISFMLL